MVSILFVAIVNTDVVGVMRKIENTLLSLSDYSDFTVKGLLIASNQFIKPLNKIIETINLDANTDFNRKAFKAIEDYIKVNYPCKTPIIYFRYPFANKFLYDFCLKYGENVIFEHNTIEFRELLLYWKYYGVRDFAYNLRNLNFSDLVGKFKLIYNEFVYGPKVLNLAKGGIAVTSEIGYYENQRANKKYTIGVVGNAIYKDSLPSIKNVIGDSNKIFKCVFIAGHANNWHGIDRLLKGIAKYKGDYRIELIYVGKVIHTVKSLINRLKISDKIIFKGICNPTELEQIISNSSLGVSSLGLHRIPLKQGSVLKTREYLLYGKPVLYSYHDEDLESDKLLKSYIIKVPADETAIDFNYVIGSFENIMKTGISSELISKRAYQRFGVESKTNALLEVLRKVLD